MPATSKGLRLAAKTNTAYVESSLCLEIRCAPQRLNASQDESDASFVNRTSFRHCSCTSMLDISPSHCRYSAGPTLLVLASPPPPNTCCPTLPSPV